MPQPSYLTVYNFSKFFRKPNDFFIHLNLHFCNYSYSHFCNYSLNNCFLKIYSLPDLF